jgi:hypothetical protein
MTTITITVTVEGDGVPVVRLASPEPEERASASSPEAAARERLARWSKRDPLAAQLYDHMTAAGWEPRHVAARQSYIILDRAGSARSVALYLKQHALVSHLESQRDKALEIGDGTPSGSRRVVFAKRLGLERLKEVVASFEAWADED